MSNAAELDTPGRRLRLFAKSNWSVLTRRLGAHARGKLGRKASEGDADDLVNEAIKRALENLDAWNPETTELADHLGSIVNSLASNMRTSRRHQTESVAHEDDVAADSSRAPADPRTGEARHLLSSLARTTVARLETLLASDALALEILALYLREVTTPKEQQAATNQEMKAILAARLKIARYATKVAAELEAEVA